MKFIFADMRHHLTLLVFSFFVFNAPFQCWAQTNPPLAGMGVEVNPFIGKVLKHEAKFHLPIPEMSSGLDLNFTYHTYGKKDWHKRRHYPIVGIGLTYTNYGIDSVYGRCISLYPNITFPLITGKKLQWTLRIGDGVAYVSHIYGRHPVTDTINNAIGSHINDYGSFNTDLRYHFNKHWDIQGGINFTHISDASYHQPNLGVNLYGAHIGIHYYPSTSSPTPLKSDVKPLKNRWLIEARTGFAFTQSDAPLGPLYPVYLESLYASHRWKSKNKAFIGVDYSYYTGIYAFLRNNEIDPGHELANSYKTAVFFGNEYLFGRLGLVLQVGIYMKQSYLAQDPYYEKLGANYYLVQHEKGPIKEFFISGFLKTHKTVAELAEFGIGAGF